MPLRISKTRYFLVLLAAAVLILLFTYLKYRPPYAVYNALTALELEQSTKSINTPNQQRKYVYFKQLQGAGFTNQVGQYPLCFSLN